MAARPTRALLPFFFYIAHKAHSTQLSMGTQIWHLRFIKSSPLYMFFSLSLFNNRNPWAARLLFFFSINKNWHLRFIKKSSPLYKFFFISLFNNKNPRICQALVFLFNNKNPRAARLWSRAYPRHPRRWHWPVARDGHFRYFLIFSLIKKWFFAFFIKLIWLGVGFLNRTGAEVGH